MSCNEQESLALAQEKADTKVFLCAKHASESHVVCIETVDSDIHLYALYFHEFLNGVSLIINYVVNKRRRVININNIAEELGVKCCRAIPALNAFTGNDYTSAFYGIGKSKAFNLMKDSDEFQTTFSLFGNSFEFDANLFASIESFVCAMYGRKCSNTNEARYKKFCSSKKKTPEPQKLPPTRDALLCHCKRVSYVTALVKRSLENSPQVPSPVNHGWIMENNMLTIDWMLLPIAPPNVLDLISCNCSKTMCRTQACVCRSHCLKCTDLCGCAEPCENIDVLSDDDVNDNDE